MGEGITHPFLSLSACESKVVFNVSSFNPLPAMILCTTYTFKYLQDLTFLEGFGSKFQVPYEDHAPLSPRLRSSALFWVHLRYPGFVCIGFPGFEMFCVTYLKSSQKLLGQNTSFFT